MISFTIPRIARWTSACLSSVIGQWRAAGEPRASPWAVFLRPLGRIYWASLRNSRRRTGGGLQRQRGKTIGDATQPRVGRKISRGNGGSGREVLLHRARIVPEKSKIKMKIKIRKMIKSRIKIKIRIACTRL